MARELNNPIWNCTFSVSPVTIQKSNPSWIEDSVNRATTCLTGGFSRTYFSCSLQEVTVPIKPSYYFSPTIFFIDIGVPDTGGQAAGTDSGLGGYKVQTFGYQIPYRPFDYTSSTRFSIELGNGGWRGAGTSSNMGGSYKWTLYAQPVYNSDSVRMLQSLTFYLSLSGGTSEQYRPQILRAYVET